MSETVDPLERVIRPIVEGQLRGFVKEHPSILKGVDWFKPRDDKAVTLVNSIAKRVVRDLICPESRKRIEDAFFVVWENESAVEFWSAADDADAGNSSGEASLLSVPWASGDNGGSAGPYSGRSASLLPSIDWVNA